jgi:hypothetical protein
MFTPAFLIVLSCATFESDRREIELIPAVSQTSRVNRTRFGIDYDRDSNGIRGPSVAQPDAGLPPLPPRFMEVDRTDAE